MYEATGEPLYQTVASLFAQRYVDRAGRIAGYDPGEQNLDMICSGRALLCLWRATNELRFWNGASALWHDLQCQPRCRCGNFWHKGIYPYQIWLDGLYMAQPFLAESISVFSPAAGYDDTLRQFLNVRRFLFDPDKKLYHHGFDESLRVFWADPKTGCSPGFWLRGMAWFAMALVDCYEAMDCPAADKQLLCKLLREMLKGLQPYSDAATGLYYQVVDQPGLPGNYLETSGNAMLSYALQKGGRLGMLPASAMLAGRHMLQQLTALRLVERRGRLVLEGSCTTAGLGPQSDRRRDGTPAYYLSEPVGEDNIHGAAALLLACGEYVGTAAKGVAS